MLTRLAAILTVAVLALAGCAPVACVTAAALESAPPVQASGASGLLASLGRQLALSIARRRCAGNDDAPSP
jgi:hypothetical protein